MRRSAFASTKSKLPSSVRTTSAKIAASSCQSSCIGSSAMIISLAYWSCLSLQADPAGAMGVLYSPLKSVQGWWSINASWHSGVIVISMLLWTISYNGRSFLGCWPPVHAAYHTSTWSQYQTSWGHNAKQTMIYITITVPLELHICEYNESIGRYADVFNFWCGVRFLDAVMKNIVEDTLCLIICNPELARRTSTMFSSQSWFSRATNCSLSLRCGAQKVERERIWVYYIFTSRFCRALESNQI